MLNVQCIICIGAIDQSSDVYSTPCGHMFHYGCLLQWLQKKKTCPQCRAPTNEHKIKRLFFNFSNNDTIVEDPTSLQQVVDDLKFKIFLQNEEIKKEREKNSVLETQTGGLRKEVRKVEKELAGAKSLVHSLKDQAKYFKEQSAEAEQLKKEVSKLREEVTKLKNVQDIIAASAEEVDSIMARTRDPTALGTYISVIKREMTTMMTKTKEHRAQIRSLRMELSKVSMERNILLDVRDRCKKLEDELQACESEKIVLQNKLQDLSGSTSMSKNLHGLSSNITKTSKLRIASDIKVVVEPKKCSKSDISPEKATDEQTKNLDEGENSPYLPVKSQGVLAIKRGHALRSIAGHSNIRLAKKRGLSQGDKREGTEQYDGFGSHSKYDCFPEPIASLKPKRLKDDPTKAKKQKQLNDFIDRV